MDASFLNHGNPEPVPSPTRLWSLMPAQPFHRLLTRLPKQASLRTVLVVPFVLQIVGAVGLIGYLSYRNGQQAVNVVAFQLCAEIGDRIHQELSIFLKAPHAIHQNSEAAIRLGYVNVQDLTGLRRFFWQQVHTF